LGRSWWRWCHSGRCTTRSHTAGHTNFGVSSGIDLPSRRPADTLPPPSGCCTLPIGLIPTPVGRHATPPGVAPAARATALSWPRPLTHPLKRRPYGDSGAQEPESARGEAGGGHPTPALGRGPKAGRDRCSRGFGVRLSLRSGRCACPLANERLSRQGEGFPLSTHLVAMHKLPLRGAGRRHG